MDSTTAFNANSGGPAAARGSNPTPPAPKSSTRKWPSSRRPQPVKEGRGLKRFHHGPNNGNNQNLNPNSNLDINDMYANPNGLANQNSFPQTSNTLVLVTLALDGGCLYDWEAEKILLAAFRQTKLEGTYTDARCISDGKDKLTCLFYADPVLKLCLEKLQTGGRTCMGPRFHRQPCAVPGEIVGPASYNHPSRNKTITKQSSSHPHPSKQAPSKPPTHAANRPTCDSSKDNSRP
jgi:hypothetical protein